MNTADQDYVILVIPPDRHPERIVTPRARIGDMTFTALRTGQIIYGKFMLHSRKRDDNVDKTVWMVDVGHANMLEIQTFPANQLH